MDYIADLLNTMSFILNKKDDGTISALIISGSSTMKVEGIAEFATRIPGVYRCQWKSSQQAKALINLTRQFGYNVSLYKYPELRSKFSDLFDLSAGDGEFAEELKEISLSLPERRTYVELFGGGAPLMMARSPASVEVHNDQGSHIVNFFRCLRNPEDLKWFFLLSRIFPLDDPIDDIELRRLLRSESVDNSVVAAYLWYRYIRQAYSSSEDDPRQLKLWETDSVEDLEPYSDLVAMDPKFLELHGRLIRVQYENNTWQKLIEIYDSEDTLFWVDPSDYGPSGLGIAEDLDGSAFNELIDTLGTVKGTVAMYYNQNDPHRGYVERSEIFEDLGNGWDVKDFRTSTVWLRNAKFKED